jgi:bacterioferritin-associated ferredoxin
MIVCSCNVLTDREVRSSVAMATTRPSLGQVYACLGCKAQCGRCAPTIKELRDEVIGGIFFQAMRPAS